MFKTTCSYCGEWYWIGNGCLCWDNLADQALKNYREKEWVGLTLDEQSDCYEKSGGNLSRFAKSIEAKLKEKNA